MFDSSQASVYLPWDDVAILDVRGPDVAEPLKRDSPMVAGGLAGLIAGIVLARTSDAVEFAWLAVGLKDGSEMIFEVQGLLRPDLERLLESHAG